MEDIKTALIDRFGKQYVTDFSWKEEEHIDLLKVDIQTRNHYRLIMTNGMSNYKMPIPGHLEAIQNRVHNELFFCLPEYWNLEDKEDPNANWPMQIIQKLAINVLENKTWYGPGHTIANGNPLKSISTTMKEEYFMLMDPIYFEEYLQPMKVGEKEVHFLAIVPIFQQEYDNIIYKGHHKWLRKFRSRNGDEILDDYRKSIHASRFLRIINGRK